MTDQTKALDPKAVEAAVLAYDAARCACHGPLEQPMSGRNRETITPMIAAAITAYLSALPAQAEPVAWLSKWDRKYLDQPDAEVTVWTKRIEDGIALYTAPVPAEPAHPDNVAVDRFAAAMKDKLAKKRADGRGGWDDKDDCSNELLSRLLREHVGKGDPVDVGNLAMMIHQRDERIAEPAPAAGGVDATYNERSQVRIAEYLPRRDGTRSDSVMVWVNERDTTKGGYSLECVPRHVAPRIVAALSRPAPAQDTASAVPEGFKLVPVEPTWPMQIAGRDAILAEDEDLDLSTDDARAAYRAMLDAAPEPAPSSNEGGV